MIYWYNHEIVNGFLSWVPFWYKNTVFPCIGITLINTDRSPECVILSWDFKFCCGILILFACHVSQCTMARANRKSLDVLFARAYWQQLLYSAPGMGIWYSKREPLFHVLFPLFRHVVPVLNDGIAASQCPSPRDAKRVIRFLRSPISRRLNAIKAIRPQWNMNMRNSFKLILFIFISMGHGVSLK